MFAIEEVKQRRIPPVEHQGDPSSATYLLLLLLAHGLRKLPLVL